MRRSPLTWYKEKPVQNEIEAKQLTMDNAIEVASWCGGVYVHEIDPFDENKKFPAINVPTLDGPKRASQGSYVAKELGGKFVVYSQEQFEAKFEELYPS
jgi:hypothetical protein